MITSQQLRLGWLTSISYSAVWKGVVIPNRGRGKSQAGHGKEIVSTSVKD